MKICKLDGSYIYQCEADNVKDALRMANLTGVNLSGANLYGANLTGVNLSGADLYRADLYGANLTGADLYRADLSGANLYRADLSGANLTGVNLSGANLYRADLSGANLTGVNLSGANLTGVNLSGANLTAFSHVPQEGSFTAFKKLSSGIIAKLEIPAEAKRTSSLVGRKNRAEFVKVLSFSDGSTKSISRFESLNTLYEVGKITTPDKYDDDIRVECSNGIHFFITEDEAKKYG